MLFHVENITPEARMKKKSLLQDGYQTVIIDDGMLQSLYESYPVLWKDMKAKPKWCLIGCPHLSLGQLRRWTAKILEILRIKHKSRLEVETVLCTAPDVIDRFKQESPDFDEMKGMGITISAMCGELFMNNPHVSVEPVITNSNKLRAYTTARYFQDQEILEIVVRGRRGNVT
jgi:predicted aconitase